MNTVNRNIVQLSLENVKKYFISNKLVYVCNIGSIIYLNQILTDQ